MTYFVTLQWNTCIFPYFSYIGMYLRYGFRGALSLNRLSFLALWSFDRVPKSQALFKT